MSSALNSKKTVVISTVVFIFSLMSIESFAGKDWELVSQLPTKRLDFTTAVVDDKIYLIGGSLYEDAKLGKRIPGPFGLSIVEMYDPERNRWQRIANMPTPRTGAKAAVVNDTIYVFGGFSGKNNNRANMKFPVVVDAYDTQTDTWARKQNMPTPWLNFGIGTVAGKIYLIGGLNIDERTDSVEIYDPAANTWAKGPKMPTRRDPGGTVVVNNRIYVIGGYGWPMDFRGGPYLATIEEYNPITHQWQQKNDMLDIKLDFSPVVIRNEIYLIGGFIWEDALPENLATVDVYNPQTQAWHNIPELPTPINPSGTAAVNGKIYVFGGYEEDWEYSTDVLVYDTGFRSVEAVGKLPVRWGALKMEPQSQP